jgi:hypothetical protein
MTPMLLRLHHVRLWLMALALLAAPLGSASAAPPAQAAGSFAGWHLPLPAGRWGISRGPCGSAARFNHNCGYYEERCGVDFVPLSGGSMENVSVLAPQAGQVFFLGTRSEAGLTLMLQHADGRVSVFFHLNKIVVGPDERVTQGQVVAYAGSTGSSGNPHVHFFVQPNAAERECVMLSGLDTLDYRLGVATSRNLAWGRLILPDPPAVPDWLPTLTTPATRNGLVLPARVMLAPNALAAVPVAAPLTAGATLQANGLYFTPVLTSTSFSVFRVPLSAPATGGNYELKLRAASGLSGTLRYTVRRPPDTTPSAGLIMLNPYLVSPTGWQSVGQAPQLCWGQSPRAGSGPFEFRVILAGRAFVDSGWLADTCWQTPRLQPGTYYWKVFVRDARGYMNRTNQRPWAFIVSPTVGDTPP